MANGLIQSFLPDKPGGQIDLSNITIRLSDIENRFGTVESRLGSCESRVNALNANINTLEALVERAEIASGTSIDNAAIAKAQADISVAQAQLAIEGASNAGHYADNARASYENAQAQANLAYERANVAGTNASNADISARNAQHYMNECITLYNNLLYFADDELSLTSTNCVQNRVITQALNTKQNTLVGAEVLAIHSGITQERVARYDAVASDYQKSLNTAQLSAVNSGITATKVGTYDNTVSDTNTLKTYFNSGKANKAIADEDNNNIKNTYATKTELTNGLNTKQDTLTTEQLSAINSGITFAKVQTYDDLVLNAQLKINDLDTIRQGASDGAYSKEHLTSVDTDITTLKGYFNSTGASRKAVADKNGKDIDATYLKKTSAESTYLSKNDADTGYFKKEVIGDISHHFYSNGTELVESKAKVLYLDLSKYITDKNITQDRMNLVLAECVASKLRCYIPADVYSVDGVSATLGAENDLDIEGQQTIINISNGLTVNATNGSNVQFKGLKFNSGDLYINTCNSAMITNCTFSGILHLKDCNNITFEHCSINGSVIINTNENTTTRFIVFQNCDFSYGTYTELIEASNAVVTFDNCSIDGKDIATFIKASNSDFVFNHCRALKCVKMFEVVSGSATISLNDVVLDYTDTNNLNNYALYIDEALNLGQVTLFGNLFMTGTKTGTHLLGADRFYDVVCEANIFTDHIDYVIGGMNVPVKIYPLTLNGILNETLTYASKVFTVQLPGYSDFNSNNIPVVVLNTLALEDTNIVNYYTKKINNSVFVFIEVDTPVTSIRVPYRVAYQSDVDLQARSLTITPTENSSISIVKTSDGKASINVIGEAGEHIADIDITNIGLTLKYGNSSIDLDGNNVNISGRLFLNGREIGIDVD